MSRRLLIQAGGASMLAGLAPLQAQRGATFTPEMFGAKGDGASDDTAAFQRLSAAVQAAGGGEVVLRPVTYRVGRQHRDPASPNGYTYVSAPLMFFTGCRKRLAVRGNGARLRANDGLRFGIFDPATDKRLDLPMPNFVTKGRASPYGEMIRISGCSGGVLVENIELDGNASAAVIGGQFGDTGWQLPATGLSLADNRCDEVVRNVHAHHHLLDGLSLASPADDRSHLRTIERVRCDNNARQGCSIVGGGGYRFSHCTFANTGSGQVSSAPGAGVDIEAEKGPIRRLRFSHCVFSDNAGCGMVADTGDSADARFLNCLFVGSRNWSAWPNKPSFRFVDCVFVGAIVRCFSGPDAAAATHFDRCRFTDDPALSPTGKVYHPGPIADLSDGTNVRFLHCSFAVSHGAALPWSQAAVYVDCRMEQKGGPASYPRGTYLGRNVIDGPVDLYGSTLSGAVIVNGRTKPA